jgi:aldehyde dehydrogenase (NAD+)
VIDPATGARIAEQALADASDVDRAVDAARRCHQAAPVATAADRTRAAWCRPWGVIFSHKDRRDRPVLTLEQGKPLWEAISRSRARHAISSITATRPSTVEGRSIPLGAGYFDFTVYEPFGVSAQIIPWNYPLEMTARSLSAALATGNACVVKTPELDPLTNALVRPRGRGRRPAARCGQHLCGHGHEAGAALAVPSRRQPDRVHRLGATGHRHRTAAAQNVVPCVLELGGKSAAIVHADADLEAFENVRWGIYFNAGQVCSAMSRVIVHESRA